MAAHVYHVSVTFQDVAACFSAEEWSGLEDWQKELYKKVMLEIHSALQGMGFEILNPDILFRIKRVKDLYIDVCDTERDSPHTAFSSREGGRYTGVKQESVSNLNVCRRRGGKPSRPPACTPDLLLRINQDDTPTYRGHRPQSPAHSAADSIINPIIPRQKDIEKERQEVRPVERPEVRTTQSQRHLTSQSIKQEKLDYVRVSVGGRNSDSPAATTRGRVTSHPAKQEGVENANVSLGSQPSDGTPTRPRDMGEPPNSDTEAAPQFPGVQVHNSHGSRLAPSPSLGVPRLRIVKFTEKELDVLVDLVIENYSKLFGKEAEVTPGVAKNAMWDAIANEVSAVGVASRTSDKVKRRWKDAKRKMNEKLSEAAAHVAETGRRPPPHLRLAPYEQRLRDFFKPEFSKEVDWNQDKEDHPEEVEADLVHQEALAATIFSPPIDLVHQESLGATTFSRPIDLVHQESLGATTFSRPIDLVHQESLAATIYSPSVDLLHQESLAATIFSPPVDLVHHESLAAAVYSPAVDLVHPESLAASVFSRQYQSMQEDSSKDSSEEPSIISPGNKPHSSNMIEEEEEPSLESGRQDKHFSTLNRTLHNLSSNQQESNILMQEQNSILSQIAYSLNLLHIQQTEGLAALGSIIQQGVEAVRPMSRPPANSRTTDQPTVHMGLRPQVMGACSSNQPIPPKRKIT
ncbi:uncharacterized protein [Hyperolius riggenbachi]|uniref:uncharacterized protein isoform X2 n=1 Tax=Hyperolius riggenbachi TaxID=752182 RepID=UPI0035A2869D